VVAAGQVITPSIASFKRARIDSSSSRGAAVPTAAETTTATTGWVKAATASYVKAATATATMAATAITRKACGRNQSGEEECGRESANTTPAQGG